MRLLFFVALVAITACDGSRSNFECAGDQGCNLSGGGRCVAADTGSSWCAYPDPDCPGGYRYSNQDVGDGLGGECVPDGQVPIDGMNEDAGPTVRLTIIKGGSGTGSIDSTPPLTCTGNTCSGDFPSGTLIQLNATTSSGAFLGWSSPCGATPDCTLTLDTDYELSVLFGIPGQVLWAQQIGTAGTDRGYGVAVAPSGDVVAVGEFNGALTVATTTLTSQGADGYIISFNGKTGDLKWAKQIGSTGNDYAYAVATDSVGDIYVVGLFASSMTCGNQSVTTAGAAGAGDGFIMKLSSVGDCVWLKQIGSTGNDGITEIAVRDAVVAFGGFYAETIIVNGTALTAGTPGRVLIGTMNLAGDYQWARNLTVSGRAQAYDIEIDSSGHVATTGGFFDTVNFGGSEMVAASGDVYLAKFNGASGAHLLSRRFGSSTGNDYAMGLAIDDTNSLIITGRFLGTADFGGAVPLTATAGGREDIFVAKYSQAGAHLVSAAYGSSGDDQGNAVEVNANGDIALVGPFCGTVSFGGPALSSVSPCADADMFALRMASNGSHLNSVRAGGAGHDVAVDVAQSSEGRWFLTGNFSGFSEFGTQALTSMGGLSDGVIVALAPL